MSKSIVGLLATSAVLTLSTAALAAGGSGNATIPWPTDGQDRTEVTLQDLRNRCESIVRNPQTKKQFVDVACDEHRSEWRECPSTFTLQDDRLVRAAVGVKDWMTQRPLRWKDDKAHDCAKFVRHEITVKWTVADDVMDCETFLSRIKTEDDLSNYCIASLKDRTQQDPAVVTDVPTGDSFDTCNGTFIKHQFGPGDQQDPCKPGPGQDQDKTEP